MIGPKRQCQNCKCDCHCYDSECPNCPNDVCTKCECGNERADKCAD